MGAVARGVGRLLGWPILPASKKEKRKEKRERVVVELDAAIPFQLGSLIGRNTFELFNARGFRPQRCSEIIEILEA